MERRFSVTEEAKTYSLDELADLLKWHKAAIKVILRKMNIDPDEPIEEIDAAALAAKLRKTWPAE